jgi:hypothetical protein
LTRAARETIRERMNIRGVKHKRLRKLIENDDAGGLQP